MSTEDHIADIHVKVSYIEEALDTLNGVVIEQQKRIDALEKALARVQAQALEGQALETQADEKPPHY